MFTSKPNAAKKPTIRRETVLVPLKKKTAGGAPRTASTASARPTPSASRFKLSERSGTKISASSVTKTKTPAPVKRALASNRGVKKQSVIPQSPAFSSDESEDDSSEIGVSDSDASRKRLKSGLGLMDTGGPTRDLLRKSAFEKEGRIGDTDFIHGADATSGEFAAKFKNPWNDKDFSTVELQYPGFGLRERFELKWPKNEEDDYKPMEDIIETVKTVCLFYFPEQLSEKYLNAETGFGRLFNRAWQRSSISDFISIIEEFNKVLIQLVDDEMVQHELGGKQHMDLGWVRRILDQIYARTVSPKVETLRVYQNGSDNVYGELLTRFCSEIFGKTNLNHESVFVDLGSGVGNVVLQAALQKGCESWGIEMMKNPCDLAELQAKEFPARTKLWGINAGAVHLIRGDFTDNKDIASVLQRADVVLVNNQAFTPALNDKLRDMFLDLKNGCRVVSLKPFVPEGHKISVRNVDSVVNLFVQKRFEYFSGSVSWTDQSGYYYIAEKDSRPLERFLKTM